MMRSFVRVGVFCALLVAPALARAQAPNKPLSESLQGAAKEAYSSAKILFSNHDFAGALTKYGQAYQQSEDARLLYDMAICEKNLHRYARMGTLLRQYEREEGAALSGDEKRIVDDALAAIKNLVGAVTLDVNEAGAAVRVDGEAAGRTPLAGALVLDLGTHTIAVAKEGFEPIERRVEITGGTDIELALPLRPRAHVAVLLVSADPEATVSVDGNVVGKGRFEGVEASGPHAIAVTKAGMRPYAAEIELREGERRTLDVTLEAEHHAAIWPWIVGGVALAAGAAVGGYFLLKPSDTTTPIPAGSFASLQFSSWKREGR
jgi:hypothetical protein